MWVVSVGLPFLKCLTGSRLQNHSKPGVPIPILRDLGCGWGSYPRAPASPSPAQRLTCSAWAPLSDRTCRGQAGAMGSPQTNSLLPRHCVSAGLMRFQDGSGGGGPRLAPLHSPLVSHVFSWSVTDGQLLTSSAHGVESVLPKGRFLGVSVHGRMMGAQA